MDRYGVSWKNGTLGSVGIIFSQMPVLGILSSKCPLHRSKWWRMVQFQDGNEQQDNSKMVFDNNTSAFKSSVIKLQPLLPHEEEITLDVDIASSTKPTVHIKHVYGITKLPLDACGVSFIKHSLLYPSFSSHFSDSNHSSIEWIFSIKQLLLANDSSKLVQVGSLLYGEGLSSLPAPWVSNFGIPVDILQHRRLRSLYSV